MKTCIILHVCQKILFWNLEKQTFMKFLKVKKGKKRNFGVSKNYSTQESWEMHGGQNEHTSENVILSAIQNIFLRGRHSHWSTFRMMSELADSLF